MKTTFSSFSFGCRVNEAEKVSIDRKLFSLGFSYDKNHPQFHIINTCAVTGKAEREVRQYVYQTRKKFPNTIIVVTGCAATNWKNNNISVSGVDILVPNDEKETIPNMLASTVGKKTEKKNKTSYYEYDKFLNSGRLMVKIQDGCNRFCSYCIVPLLRGLPHSRPTANIIEEINAYEKPLHEVILTAINTEAFGKDTGETLEMLIEGILNHTSVPLISFGSIHPWSLTDAFLSFYASMQHTGRIKPFFHIPIQSGSDSVLERMNRQYKGKDILQKLKKIKTNFPDAHIGTDIIVGFPGETKTEFQETVSFLKKAPIDSIHVFRYSPRPKTKASAMEKIWGSVSPEEKRMRSKTIMELYRQ